MKQKYCLRSIAPFSTINNSLANNSKTKQTYSFSKSSRFQLNDPGCPVSTYSGHDMRSSRTGAIIGYGKKQTFPLNNQKSPGSDKYQIKTIFDANKLKSKGYTLTLSRQKIAYDSYVSPNKLKLPGVGRYHLETETAVKTSRAPSYTLRKKTKVHDLTQTIEPQNLNPSPAHYQNNPQTSQSLFSTNFKRLSYSGSRSKRFFNPDNKVPGPGDYQNPTDLSNAGNYIKSSHRGGTRAKFDNQKRITQFQRLERASIRIPGPGSYRQSSQFGHYDGDVYQRSPSKRTIPQRY